MLAGTFRRGSSASRPTGVRRRAREPASPRRQRGGREMSPGRQWLAGPAGSPSLVPLVTITVRRATAADAEDVARLLHDFNTEFSEPSPGAAVLAERAAPLLESGEIVVLLGGEGPD